MLYIPEIFEDATCIWKICLVFLCCNHSCIENIVRLCYTTEKQLQTETEST